MRCQVSTDASTTQLLHIRLRKYHQREVRQIKWIQNRRPSHMLWENVFFKWNNVTTMASQQYNCVKTLKKWQHKLASQHGWWKLHKVLALDAGNYLLLRVENRSLGMNSWQLWSFRICKLNLKTHEKVNSVGSGWCIP